MELEKIKQHPKCYFSTNNGVLLHGDCLEVMKELPENSVDLIATDPPYKITSRGSSGSTGGMLKTKLSMDGKIFKHNDILIEDWLIDCFRVLKDSGHFYIMCNQVNLHHYLDVIEQSDLRYCKALIWNKGNKLMNGYYMSQFEFVLFCYKGAAKMINNCGTSDILSFQNSKTKNGDGDNIHDTEKPVGLMSVLIENSSNTGDVVFDPFMGSGTTAVAAQLTGRRWLGCEISEAYCAIAAKRINKASKQFSLFEGKQ